MTQEQFEEYLGLPMIADLATVNPDGSPHVAPVWFRWDGEVVKVFTQTTAVKVRNIRHDARVSMSVAKQDAPYGYVIVNGTAAISSEGIPDEVRAMAIHYKGEVERARYTSGRRCRRWSSACLRLRRRRSSDGLTSSRG